MTVGLGPKNLAVFACEHVFSGSPILFVSHSGGDWQFLCGGDHEASAQPRVVGIGHLLDRDPTLTELESLPVDWDAERDTPDSAWRTMSADAEDD